VLASFDTGDPAVVEVPLGKGRLFVLTSGWQPEDSQLALSTKFVPLLYALLDQSGAGGPLPIQYQVGDVVPLRTLVGESHSWVSIRTPEGAQVAVATGE